MKLLKGQLTYTESGIMENQTNGNSGKKGAERIQGEVLRLGENE